MTWLIPSVTATLISSIVLSFAYLVLSYIEKQKHLWIWFFAWITYSLRFIFMLLYINYPEIILFAVLNLNFSLLSGLLLYWGTISWQKLKIRKSIVFIGALLSVNSVIGNLVNSDFYYQTAPIYIYIGIIYLGLGWRYLKSKESRFGVFLGILFIIWGLHKIDYPFIRQISSLAPWGYLLGAALAMLVSTSMILHYLLNAKKNLNYSNRELQLDIQKRKKIELDYDKQKKIAEDANRVKNNFLSNISHELRTPLNGAIGMIELLKDMEQTEESTYYLDLASQSVDRLFSIIKNLLDFVQIDSGSLCLIVETFNIDTMIKHSIGVFSNQLKEKNLSISFKNNNTYNNFAGDKARIAQIIVSLLSNAVKFSKNGVITISYSIDPDLKISISDEGIGIPEDKIAEIFKTLQQLEDPYTKQYDGIGIGLAIVKNLVDLMGGSIKVNSEPGKGTTFTITIPASENTQLKEEIEVKPNYKSALSPEDFPILIAENEGINRIFIREILKKHKFPVIEAKNGKEVLDLVETHSPRLILMDIEMPVLNGHDAAIELRKMERFMKTPILALTAYTGKDDILQFLSAGFNEILGKPIVEDELITKIREYSYARNKDNYG